MYTLRIVDYLKCARSLKSEIFGPAQLMHVSTFDIGIGFITPNVDENGIIADFAAAQKSLNDTLAPPYDSRISTMSRKSRTSTRRPRTSVSTCAIKSVRR